MAFQPRRGRRRPEGPWEGWALRVAPPGIEPARRPAGAPWPVPGRCLPLAVTALRVLAVTLAVTLAVAVPSQGPPRGTRTAHPGSRLQDVPGEKRSVRTGRAKAEGGERTLGWPRGRLQAQGTLGVRKGAHGRPPPSALWPCGEPAACPREPPPADLGGQELGGRGRGRGWTVACHTWTSGEGGGTETPRLYF